MTMQLAIFKEESNEVYEDTVKELDSRINDFLIRNNDNITVHEVRDRLIGNKILIIILYTTK